MVVCVSRVAVWMCVCVWSLTLMHAYIIIHCAFEKLFRTRSPSLSLSLTLNLQLVRNTNFVYTVYCSIVDDDADVDDGDVAEDNKKCIRCMWQTANVQTWIKKRDAMTPFSFDCVCMSVPSKDNDGA